MAQRGTGLVQSGVPDGPSPPSARRDKEEREELAALRRRLDESERARLDAEARLEKAERRHQGKSRLIESLEQRIADLVQACSNS